MTKTNKIDISYFFSQESHFPWQWFGGCPVSAPAHVYICDMLSPLASNPVEKSLLSGRPSLTELQRYVNQLKVEGERTQFCKDIIEYQSKIALSPGPNRRAEVFDFLKNSSEYIKFFAKTVTHKHKQNFIYLPDEAFCDE